MSFDNKKKPIRQQKYYLKTQLYQNYQIFQPLKKKKQLKYIVQQKRQNHNYVSYQQIKQSTQYPLKKLLHRARHILKLNSNYNNNSYINYKISSAKNLIDLTKKYQSSNQRKHILQKVNETNNDKKLEIRAVQSIRNKKKQSSKKIIIKVNKIQKKEKLKNLDSFVCGDLFKKQEIKKQQSKKEQIMHLDFPKLLNFHGKSDLFVFRKTLDRSMLFQSQNNNLFKNNNNRIVNRKRNISVAQIEHRYEQIQDKTQEDINISEKWKDTYLPNYQKEYNSIDKRQKEESNRMKRKTIDYENKRINRYDRSEQLDNFKKGWTNDVQATIQQKYGIMSKQQQQY